MFRAVVVVAILIALPACKRRGEPLPAPPSAEGAVVGQAFDARTGGWGGLRRITLALHGPTGEYNRVEVWVDSLTRFVGPERDSVDWSLPQLRGAHVRVWFRSAASTPNAGEVWARAAIIAIDSLAR